MFPTKRTAFSFTVLIYLALALASVGTVAATGHGQAQDVHHRMIKKRQGPAVHPIADPALPASSTGGTSTTANTASAASDPTSTSTAASSIPTSKASSTIDTNTSSALSTQTSSSLASSTSSGSSSSSIVSSSSSSSSISSSSSSSSPSSSSSSSVATTPPNTSNAAAVTPTPAPAAPAPGTTAAASKSIVHTAVTLTASAAATETSGASATSTVSKTTKTTLGVIAAIAGSVGGAFLIWTIIRKWKFRPSAEFEDRMQPIDWQPTDNNDGLPAHRRAPSNASSFHSGAGHSTHDDNLAGRGMGGYGATSDQAHSGVVGVPEHDFTAPAVQPGLAPVGGYADLARGPSPQPQMQQLGGAYDYNAPLHYGGYQQQQQPAEPYYGTNGRY